MTTKFGRVLFGCGSTRRGCLRAVKKRTSPKLSFAFVPQFLPGRVNDHSCGVSLRVTHGLQRAVALNFLNSNGSRGAFQFIGLFKLRESCQGFVESFLIFFGVNAGNNFIPLKLAFGALEFVEKSKGGSGQHDLAGLTAEKSGLVHTA